MAQSTTWWVLRPSVEDPLLMILAGKILWLVLSRKAMCSADGPERQKLTRLIKRFQKASTGEDAKGKSKAGAESDLEKARIMLNYVVHFPSVLPTPLSSCTADVPVVTPSDTSRCSLVRTALKARTMTRIPDRLTSSFLRTWTTLSPTPAPSRTSRPDDD